MTKNVQQNSPEGENNNLGGFSKNPILLNGYGSYYPTAIQYADAEWAIVKEPIPSIHNNGKFLVRAMKIDNSLPYGSKETVGVDMIYENGTLQPLAYKVGMNNHADRVSEHGIIDVSIEGRGDGYKLYDENFQTKDFPGTPEGFHVGRIHFDDKRVTIYSDDREAMNSEEVYLLNDDMSIEAVKGIPQGGKLKDIKDDVVGVVSLNGSSLQYFYNQERKEVLPFIFKGMEGKEYTIRFIHPDQGYIQLEDKLSKEVVGYVFDGTTNVLDEKIGTNPGEYSGDRYNPQKKLLHKHDKKEVVLIGKNNEEIPFSGLAAHEEVDHEETYKLGDRNNLPLVMVKYKEKEDSFYPVLECRWYNKDTGEISPIAGKLPEWKVRGTFGANGKFIGITIKINGWSDETSSLINRAGNAFVLYNGLAIGGVISASKQLRIITKNGPDVTLTLSDDEWNVFMKEWDPTYVDTKEKIAEVLSS